MNWKAFVLILCLVAPSYSWAQGIIHFGGEINCTSTQILERDWTLKVGTRHFGFAQYRKAQDLNGKDVPQNHICNFDPQYYRWQQRTAVHLGITQFTTSGTASKSIALASAFPLALGFSFFFWKRSRKG